MVFDTYLLQLSQRKYLKLLILWTFKIAEPEATQYIESKEDEIDNLLQKCSKTNLKTIINHCASVLKGRNIDILDQKTIRYLEKFEDDLGKSS